MVSKPIIIRSEGLFPVRRKVDPGLVRLAAAMLTQAIRDLLNPKRKLEPNWKEWLADSRSWFNSRVLEPGSFHWVCQVIWLTPEMVLS